MRRTITAIAFFIALVVIAIAVDVFWVGVLRPLGLTPHISSREVGVVMVVFQVTFGIFATIIGVCFLLGIMRCVWGGGFGGAAPQNYRDRVPVGAIASRGFGLLFTCAGLAFLLGHTIPKPLSIVFLVCVFVAFFLIFGGLLLDHRAHDVERRAYRLPEEMRTGTPDERRRWIFAACGALLLFVMILALLFSR